MDLFISTSLVFDKTASAEAALPEDPNAWGNEILQELYKQVPFVADFDPETVMNQIDGQRGFGFGYVLISNKTELAADASDTSREAAGVKSVRIPIIVKDSKLQPLDLLVTGEGKTVPLTETRLREALFRPQTFDISARSPGDTSLINQLMPPMRQGMGTPTGQTGSVDMGKTGSVLARVLPAVTAYDFVAFTSAMEDPALQAACIKNAHAMVESLSLLQNVEPMNLAKTAAVFPHLLRANVAQVVKENEGYSLKTASRLMWDPITQSLDRGDVLRRFGEKIALAADLQGGVTMTDGADDEPSAETEDEEGPLFEVITEYGMYRVQDDQGRDLVGYVFPNLLDLDGRELPLALFTNGSQAAVQAEIAGVRVGEAAPMHEGKPKGRGCFFTLENGEPLATLPLTIGGSFQGPDGGVALMAQAETIDSQQVEVHVQPNLQKMILADGALLVPDSYRWLSLDGAESVVLVSAAGEENKAAHVRNGLEAVSIRGSLDCFSLEGSPLAKVAEDQRSQLSSADALFLLAGLGVNLKLAQKKLAEASLGQREVTVHARQAIKTAAELMHDARGRAEERLAGLPDLRRVLFKEAAVIPDPGAVDTVLALGFINPENIASVLKSVPAIEDSQQKMCTLLLATRLGIKDIQVSAIERAVHSTEEVLSGLKVLAFQKN